jgi:virginiamycin B lyase
MRMKSTLLVAALLCAATGAMAQMQSDQGEPALPAGQGQATVQAACTRCHELTRVTSSGYTRAGWQQIVNMMVSSGAPVKTDQIPVVVDYLAKNFPEKPAPPAVVIPGAVDVSIQEWTLPTPGSRPHDPLVAPNGDVWYTGNMANLLGRFNPHTQQFKEYHLKMPHSGPHGLVADKDGNIWFTANQAAYVGKLDPKTGHVAEYDMPDPNATDPHTPVFDHGILFFSLQSSDMIGKLDPRTGKVKLVTVPTRRALPYGMVVNSKGTIFFDEFGANKIGRMDPETMEIHEYPLPDPKARPRRIGITSDDIIWYTDYSRGYLGRLDPATGTVTEWLSPGGPKSKPYGITVANDIVWYSESGTKPNTVVRFDPKTKKFQTWIIPSGGGVVRNMVHAPDGKTLWLACSGVNGIAEVKIKSGEKSAGL